MISFILANSANPDEVTPYDEMAPYVAFHLVFHPRKELSSEINILHPSTIMHHSVVTQLE